MSEIKVQSFLCFGDESDENQSIHDDDGTSENIAETSPQIPGQNTLLQIINLKLHTKRS